MGATNDKTRALVGLPPKPFLYSLDQIADLISLPLDRLERELVWFAGRQTGPHFRGKLLARNIAANAEQKPIWRVAERELLRWMKVKGFRVHDRGFITH